jgi:hypothetical protein
MNPDATPRYSHRQLGQLLEITSQVQCECPNQLAGIVLALQDYERYTADCENRNEADAAIHQMLYQETIRARAIMEEALARLCAFENITVPPDA